MCISLCVSACMFICPCAGVKVCDDEKLFILHKIVSP